MHGSSPLVRRLPFVALFAAGAGLVLSACGASTSVIEVSGAVLPPPATPSEASLYLTITNTGDLTDELLSVETDAAPMASLHETEIDDSGMAMMDDTDTLAIPADSTVRLVPGGLHIMLMDPAPLDAGDTIFISLTFKEAGVKTVEATVVNDATELPS